MVKGALATWTLQSSPPSGFYQIRLKVTGSGGATAETTRFVRIDHVPPLQPDLSQPASPTTTQPITVTGTAEENTTVEFYVNDEASTCTDCNDAPDAGAQSESLQCSIAGGVTVTGVEVCNGKDDNCNGRVDENIDNNSCTFCGLKGSGTPVNFMSGAKTTLPQRDFLLNGINGFDPDFYRLYSSQAREEVPQALKTMVRGNVSGPNIHTVLVNGSPASVINGVWQKEVTLTPGANTITATAEIEGIPLEDTADVRISRWTTDDLRYTQQLSSVRTLSIHQFGEWSQYNSDL